MTINDLVTKLTITLIFTSVMVINAELQATPFDLKPLYKTHLEKGENNSLAEDSKGLPTITMLFQPKCSWCKKQGKTLAEAFKQCKSSINIRLVGVKGNIRELRKEFKHYHQSIPAYVADHKFLRAIGGYEASPTTLIYNEENQLITKKRGFIPHNNLSEALTILSKGRCNI